ncbi:CaiB/BaiF CoA-transferase family protein [Pararhodobacter sp. CCB-MM2]|uniref:CaiB/BaiF CoA transferase family protein n=1 Tax=Pararhodobacter sp. CCB-MM2 TaxID=1786003 RepID=UPI00082D94BD|nr:CoA transferase [Pararhodobacter sp. CCB-MM2]
MTQRALTGIKVADFSHVVAGPLATHFLALNGAEVLKIEPARGDNLRNYTLDPAQRGMAPAFAGINAGKGSVVLDLKTEEGRAEAEAIIAASDVVVENFRPGVMARLGLGAEAMRAKYPHLVWCAISGFGQVGPLADVAAMDQIIQSLSGLMLLSGLPGDPAQRIGFPLVDTFTGLLAAFAIQTALLQRERGLAEGQEIDVAMLDAALVMMLSVVNPMLMTGEAPVRTGNRGFSRAPTSDTFACAEGTEITIGAVEDGHVAKTLGILGLSDLLADPRFADRAARAANADAMAAEIARALSARPAADWEAEFRRLGVPAARVQGVGDALAMPHLEDRDLFLTLPGAHGPQRILNAGFRFRHGGPGTDRPAPRLGAGPVTTD